MLRPLLDLCRKALSLAGRGRPFVVLTFCVAAIQAGEANGLTAAPLSGVMAEAAGPAAPQPAAYCNGRRPCPEEEGPSEPYRVGPPVEVPCEDAPLPRAYTYRADPPGGYVERRAYEEEVVREERYCGIRCWYRRIREGYCGRGCDYYMFRLRHFPSGRFGEHSERRLACRTRW